MGAHCSHAPSCPISVPSPPPPSTPTPCGDHVASGLPPALSSLAPCTKACLQSSKMPKSQRAILQVSDPGTYPGINCEQIQLSARVAFIEHPLHSACRCETQTETLSVSKHRALRPPLPDTRVPSLIVSQRAGVPVHALGSPQPPRPLTVRPQPAAQGHPGAGAGWELASAGTSHVRTRIQGCGLMLGGPDFPGAPSNACLCLPETPDSCSSVTSVPREQHLPSCPFPLSHRKLCPATSSARTSRLSFPVEAAPVLFIACSRISPAA